MATISIILAVYNGEKEVEHCLATLQNQTFQDIEIICVDDGSTDNTLAILKQHADTDPRVKVYAQGENKKLLMAIKRGVKEATGDYIMFIDADDWYEADACEKVADVIAADHPDVVYFGTNPVEPEEEERQDVRENRRELLRSYDWKFTGDNTLGLEFIKYTYLWNKAVKADVCRAAYDAIPDIPMLFHSDMYACQMIHYYAKSLSCISDNLLNHDYSDGISAKPNMTAESYDFFCKCTRMYEDGVADFFEKHGLVSELKHFKDGYLDRLMLCIIRWRDKVIDEESWEALESLLSYYDPKDVVPMLKHNYHEVNIARRKHLKMLQDNNLK